MNCEIERKFLLTEFPDSIPLLHEYQVNQFYLSVAPEVRMREKADGENHSYWETIKSSGDLTRIEVEFPIEAQVYRQSLSIVGKPPIQKEHREYALSDGLLFEVSCVDGEFYYGEVEYRTVEEAGAWTVPEALIPFVMREITHDNAFKMKNYWKKTRG